MQSIVTEDNLSNSRPSLNITKKVLYDNLEDYIVETLNEFIRGHDILPIYNKYKCQTPLPTLILNMATEDMQRTISKTLNNITNVIIRKRVESQVGILLNYYINSLQGVGQIYQLSEGKIYKH